jgi:hypothetical protein
LSQNIHFLLSLYIDISGSWTFALSSLCHPNPSVLDQEWHQQLPWLPSLQMTRLVGFLGLYNHMIQFP